MHEWFERDQVQVLSQNVVHWKLSANRWVFLVVIFIFKLTQFLNDYCIKGTLYKYDIFAAEPCCTVRVACKQCGLPLLDLNKSGGLPYFSMYSELHECGHCRFKDFHFIKPLDEVYDKCEESGIFQEEKEDADKSSPLTDLGRASN